MSGFKLPSNWETNMQYLAQIGHFFGALSIVVIAALFSGTNWVPILITISVGVIAAAVKEFVLDVRPPENDSWANSAMDFAFYMLGAAVGTGLVGLEMYLHGR